jgi:DNA-binding SARP family transcriptional activator
MNARADGAVRINVLGQVEMSHGDEPVRLAERQRVLLAALALDYGQIVPVERLIEVLWATAPPASARTKLQAHVCALRQAAGQSVRQEHGLLVTGASGYMLCGDAAVLDLAEFDSLTAQARSAHESRRLGEASQLFASALALWRGAPFADVASPAIAAAAVPLEERRVLAVEAKAEADLSLGRYAAVAAELPPWLFRLPLRERLRGLLMIALYRLGCRVEALKLYRDGRRLMTSQVGLEPGARLQALHRHILADTEAIQPREPAGFGSGLRTLPGLAGPAGRAAAAV